MSLVPTWTSSNTAKESFKRVITQFQARHLDSEDFAQANVSYLQSLLERLQINWTGYTRTHGDLIIHFANTEGDMLDIDDGLERELQEVSKIYDDARQLIEEKIKEIKRKAQVYRPKPEEVTLTTFSGKYSEYTLFRSAVQARVINSEFPAHVKIDMIIKALRGEALKHVGATQGQDEAELERIWTALESTYHNPYVLVRSHLAEILDLSNIQHASARDYRLMIDTVRQTLHAISQLDIDISTWDPIIIEILLRKLDVDFIEAWETSGHGIKPSLDAFIKFLEDRILVLSSKAQAQVAQPVAKTNTVDVVAGTSRESKRNSSEADRQSWRATKRYKSTSTDSSGRSATRQAPAPLEKCPMQCKNPKPHHLWICRSFLKLDLAARLRFVQEKGLCKRCVTLSHPIEDCDARRCKDCKDVHNIILCPRYMVVAKVHTAQTSRSKRHHTRDRK